MVMYLALFFLSARSPFQFDDFSLRQIKISFGGQSFPSYNGIRIDSSDISTGIAEAYLHLCQNTLLCDSGVFQTMDDFLTGNCFFLFNLGNVVNFEYDHAQKLKSASGRINLVFDSAAKNECLTLCLFSLTDEVISISSDRIVSKGYIS